MNERDQNPERLARNPPTSLQVTESILKVERMLDRLEPSARVALAKISAVALEPCFDRIVIDDLFKANLKRLSGL